MLIEPRNVTILNNECIGGYLCEITARAYNSVG